MYVYTIMFHVQEHVIRSPHELTSQELQQYTYLISLGFSVVKNADDLPTAVLAKNGVEVCLIDTIVAYTELDDEEAHIFENINDLVIFVNNHVVDMN
jgi:hypothetical protein